MNHKRINIFSLKLLIYLLPVIFFHVNIFAQNPEPLIQIGHSASVYTLDFSPDGRILASGSDDNSVKLWDTTNGLELRTLSGHEREVLAVKFSPDGKVLASGSADNTVKLWEVSSGKLLHSFEGSSCYGETLRFSSDGKIIRAGDLFSLKTWNIADGKVLSEQGVGGFGCSQRRNIYFAGADDKRTINANNFKTRPSIVSAIDFDKKIILKAFSLWGFKNEEGLNTRLFTIKIDTDKSERLEAHADVISWVAFSPDYNIFATSSWDETVIIWNAETFEKIRIVKLEEPILGLNFSNDGKRIAAFSDEKIYLLDVATGNIFNRIEEANVETVSFSKDDKFFATSGSPIKIWSVETAQQVGNFRVEKSPEAYLTKFSPSSKKFLIQTLGGVQIYKLDGSQTVNFIRGFNYRMDSSFKENGSALIHYSSDYIDWDIEKQKIVFEIGNSNTPYIDANVVDFANSVVAIATTDNRILVEDFGKPSSQKVLGEVNEKINSISLSQDSRYLVVCSHNSLQIRDINSAQIIKSLERNSNFMGGLKSCKFSPNGKTIAIVNATKYTIDLYDVQSGQIVNSFTYREFINSYSFSTNGDLLAFTDGNNAEKKTTIVETKNENAIKVFEQTETSQISSDGKTIAVGSTEYVNGQSIHKINIYDIETGKDLKQFLGHTEKISDLAFSPDGKFLASTSEEDRTTIIWDIEKVKEHKVISDSIPFVDVKFSADSKNLMTGNWQEIRVRDVQTGKLIYQNGELSKWSSEYELSPDKTILAYADNKNSLILRDIRQNKDIKVLHTFEKFYDLQGRQKINEVLEISFSEDGKKIAAMDNNCVAKVWDLATGKEIGSIAFDHWSPFDFSLSPKGTFLIFKKEIWKVADGKKLHPNKEDEEDFEDEDFEEKEETDEDYDSYDVYFSAISLDEKLFFKGIHKILKAENGNEVEKNWVEISDVQSGNVIGKFDAEVSEIKFSPLGNFLITDKNEIWNINTRQKVLGFSTDDLFFSPNDRLVAANYSDKLLEIWDMQTGKQVEIKSRLPEWIKAQSVGKFAKFDVQALVEGKNVVLYNLQTKEEIAKIFVTGENDWLVMTPDGLFDGTTSAWQKVAWRFNNNTLDYAPIEAFFNDFYFPGLLEEVLAGNEPKAPKNFNNLNRRQPLVNFLATNKDSEQTANPTQKVTIEALETVSDKKGELRDLRLFRNGSLVKIWRGETIDEIISQNKNECRVENSNIETFGRKLICETEIPVITGRNQLSSYIFNGDNIKSGNAILEIQGAESLRKIGRLYVLAIGVNQYKNTAYNLRYAVPDVEDISKKLSENQNPVGQYAKTEIIKLTDKNAAKANIIEALNQLSSKTKPEDGLVIYFAGHGLANKDRFYLIPHDGFPVEDFESNQERLNNIFKNSVSDEDLEMLLEKIDVGKMLMVIDACNSGQALEATEKRRGPMNSRGLAQLAYEKGMYILTASQSDKAALEVTKIGNKEVGHGLLTWALLEGLSDQSANSSPDAVLTEREWFTYAVQKVPQYQLEMMNARSAENKKLPPVKKRAEVFYVQGDDKKLPPEKRGLQTPRIFYRRELEENPFIVKKINVNLATKKIGIQKKDEAQIADKIDRPIILEPKNQPNDPDDPPPPPPKVPNRISGGVINSKAINLEKPVYTQEAKDAGANGSVSVSVVIDKDGNVISATAVSGHQLLREACEKAALLSKFEITKLSGVPIEVSGIIIYNFVSVNK